MVEKSTTSRKIFVVFNTLFMIGFAFICFAPLLHVIMASISEPRLLMQNNKLLLWPLGKATLRGYGLVLNSKNIINGYINTIFYVVSSTFLGLILTLISGFLLSRKDFRISKFLTVMILFTMMFNGGMIPTYMVVKGLHWINTPFAVIIPGVINAFFILIMKSTIEQLPASYEEAAMLEGASQLRILFSIIVPLVKSFLAVVIIFTAVLQWNSWFQASIYLTNSRDLWPLQLIMREILVQNDITTTLTGSEANLQTDLFRNLVKYSSVVVSTLPILCIYPFCQKYFVQGVTLGGVKG